MKAGIKSVIHFIFIIVFLFVPSFSSVIVQILPFESRGQVGNTDWLSEGLQFVLEEKISVISSDILIVRDKSGFAVAKKMPDFVIDGGYTTVDESVGLSIRIYNNQAEQTHNFIFNSESHNLLRKMNDIAERISLAVAPEISVNQIDFAKIPTESWLGLSEYFSGLTAIKTGKYIDGLDMLRTAFSHDRNFIAAQLAFDYYSSHYPLNSGKFILDVNTIQTQIKIEDSIPDLIESLVQNVYSGKIIELDVVSSEGNLHTANIFLQVEYKVDKRMIDQCIFVSDSLGFDYAEKNDVLRFSFRSTDKLSKKFIQKLVSRAFYQFPLLFFKTMDSNVLLISDGVNLESGTNMILEKKFSPMFGLYHNPWEVTLVIEKGLQTINYSFSVPLKQISSVREIVIEFGTTEAVNQWISELELTIFP